MAKIVDKNIGKNEPICIAILAVGGQGGGVLSNWLITVAELEDWVVQSTSVPGVAQRTGATIYYLEVIQKSKKAPILGLMPSPGHVDLVVATEWMEAGRAIQRGLVSPDKTILLASSHRNYAVAEKINPGDGIADAEIIDMVATATAKEFIYLDLQKIAEDNGSVISASSLGAIAGSGALPFAKKSFQEAIKKSGVGVANSLKSFDAAFTATQNYQRPDVKPTEEALPLQKMAGGKKSEQRKYQQLQNDINNSLPAEVHYMVHTGLNRVIDFQNTRYAEQYLDIMTQFFALDEQYGTGKSWSLTENLAKYLANAMSYQDVIRVADFKIRKSRFARVDKNSGRQDNSPLSITEFMHPRVEEMQGLIPHRLRFLADTSMMRFVLRQFAGSKRLRSDKIGGFLLLYILANMRKRRLGTIRHAQEWVRIDEWLKLIEKTVKNDYALALEIVQMQQLIKGYSDTHERTTSKYHKVLKALPMLKKQKDAAGWARRLREAALRDAEGKALDDSIKSIKQL